MSPPVDSAHPSMPHAFDFDTPRQAGAPRQRPNRLTLQIIYRHHLRRRLPSQRHFPCQPCNPHLSHSFSLSLVQSSSVNTNH